MLNEQTIQIRIRVNGQPMTVPRGTTIEGLLRQLEIPHSSVAVENNALICSQESFSTVVVEESDSFEIVSLAGGG